MSDVPPAALRHLIMWPEGTNGHALELRLVTALDELCREFGYGRVSQVVSWIEDLWRRPERADHYEAQRAEHLKFLEEARSHLRQSPS